MARRKIVAGQEEIEYRLLTIIRRTDKMTGTQIKGALAGVAALAEMWKVPLGQTFWSIIRSFSYVRKGEETAPPEDIKNFSPTPTPPAPEEDLTPDSIGGIFDGLEDNDGDKED